MLDTWTCHICGEERPDAQISVYSKPRDFGGGVIAQENIRYCNDREECRAGVQTYSHGKEKKE